MLIGLESATSHSLATKNWCSMLGCQVAEAENVYFFGISIASLASPSTSSTSSTVVVVSNNLQSKVAMALVSLQRSCVFDGDAMLMASAVKVLIIRILFFFFFFFFCKKSLACLCRGAHQDERQDLSGPGEFQ